MVTRSVYVHLNMIEITVMAMRKQMLKVWRTQWRREYLRNYRNGRIWKSYICLKASSYHTNVSNTYIIIIFYIRINFYDAWIRVGRWGVRRRGSGVINPRQSPIVIWSSNMQIHNTDPPFFCQPASQTVLVALRQHEILINANLKCVQANTYVIDTFTFDILGFTC